MTPCPLLPLLEYDGTPATRGWQQDAIGPGALTDAHRQAYTDPALLHQQARANFRRLGELYGYVFQPDTARLEAIDLIAREFMDGYPCPPNVHWLSLWRWRLWRLTCIDPYHLPYPWPTGDPVFPKLHPFMGFLRQYTQIRWVYREDRPRPEAVAAHVAWRRSLGLGGPPERDWWQLTGMTQAEIDAELMAAEDAEDIRPTGGEQEIADLEALALRYELPGRSLDNPAPVA